MRPLHALLAVIPLAACASSVGSNGGADARSGEQDAGLTPADGGAPPDAGSPGGDLGPGGDFRAYADRAATALHGFYGASTGLWNTTNWWNAANALTAAIDHALATGSTALMNDVANTFDKNQGTGFLNDYYDDEGWWALAWIRAFDLTQDGRYLAMAKAIFADMVGGWDDTCGGGIWWRKARDYKNAIANELFLEVAAQLHLRTAGDTGPGSYLEWAERTWAWFDASGMINGNGLVNDGLAGCVNNGDTVWTYNQGVLIGGLVDLAAATGEAGLLDRAGAIATASMAALVDGQGVLREPCEADGCGADGPQFKGVFMRHLGRLQAVTGDARLRAFIAHNADWIWNAGRSADDRIGLHWSGPFDRADAARQSSALDALNAAIAFSDPQPNVASAKAATASGACAADEAADRVVDGSSATKWCSGTEDGTYSLEIDLGAATTVGRIIVRHAGAGGEQATWNTRDFTLEVDGETVATVRGNTSGVTIHRFAPVTTQRIRLVITAPQSDPATVAARIYEIEAFPR